MNRLDDQLRAALTAPAGKRFSVIVAVLGAAAWLCSLFTPVLTSAAVGEGNRAASALLLFFSGAVMMLAAADLSARADADRCGVLLLTAAALCGAVLRTTFLAHLSADYENYLAGWMTQLSSGSFSEVMRAQIGEYNVLYQYLLFLCARLPVSGLLAVKAVSLLGDAFLCWGLGRLAGKKNGMPAFIAALLLPSILLNGSMFAQCDSLYAAAAVWALVFALEERHCASAVCFALSLAFKLQAVFLFPILPVLWMAKKLRLSDIPVFIGTLLLTMLPALLGGKSIGAILGYYVGQTGLYTGLTYGAPTLFGLLNTTGLDVYAYGRLGILLAMGCALLVMMQGLRHCHEGSEALLHTALLVSTLVVFFLPRMHERYFYLPVVLSLAMACRRPRFLPCAVLLELASASRLLDMGIPLRAASLMVLAAAVLLILPEAKDPSRRPESP